MEIKVLGPGCANCVRLEKVVREALADLGIDAQVVKVSEIRDIMSYWPLSRRMYLTVSSVQFAAARPSVKSNRRR